MLYSATITDARIARDLELTCAQYRSARLFASVEVKTEDCDEFITIFSFYPDELHFSPSEFIGKTVGDVHEIRYRRVLEYIQSP